MSRRRRPEVVDEVAPLRERQRILTRLATSSMPYDPPLPATHPLAVFCARWNRAGGFTYHADEAHLARLVEMGEWWAAELDLSDDLARIERHWQARKETT